MKFLINRLPFLLLVGMFVLQGCKEEQEHPEVQTLQIVVNSPSSVTLKGNVVNRGTYNVVDYGFVYSYDSYISETNGTRVVMGQDVPVGNYEKVITGLLGSSSYYNRTIYARAFIKNEKGTVFGQVSSVVLPSPNISSIAPTSGKAGDRITINGSFYTSAASEVEVTFGGAVAKTIEVTPSKVVVEVPTSASFSSYYGYTQVPVVLKLAGQSYTVTSSFKITPTVSDFSPKSGLTGTVITITGENIPTYNYYGTIRAYIGDTEVAISSLTSNSFKVTVPSSISTAKAAVKVVADGITTFLPGEFTLTPHTIASVTSASGLPGSTFTVNGTFTASSYYNIYPSAKIGDTPATVSLLSSNQLSVTVPQNMIVGSYPLTITIGPHTVEAPQQFQVLAPTITTFSPTSGGSGSQITINGAFVAGQSYTVYFGNASTSAYATSATTLRAYVPYSLSAGKVQISIQLGNQRIYAAEDFTKI